MPDAKLQSFFGMSISAAYTRAVNANRRNELKGICIGFSEGFSMQQSDGEDIYEYYQSLPSLSSTNLDLYNLYEEQVATIINNSYPDVSTSDKQILTITAHALIFSASLNTNIELSTISYTIGAVLFATANRTLEVNPITVDPKGGGVIHPFWEEVVSQLLTTSYSPVITAMAGGEKDVESKVVNYNWFDCSKFFTSPNLQIMKDIENQYYSLSGELLYKSLFGDIKKCITDKVSITVGGIDKQIIYIRNIPCIETGSYIGPPDGVKFNRIFSDGPNSIGNFTSGIKQAYIDFDKNVLPASDLQSNLSTLYSFETGEDGEFLKVSNSKAYIHGPARYNLETELSGSPDCHSKCGLIPYTKMHIGDNLPKWRIVGDCESAIEEPCTGFKFAALEIDPKTISLPLITNPVPSNSTAYQRMLNLIECPYYATSDGSSYIPEYYVGDINPIKFEYVGPPQLSGGNNLPFFAFWQTFDDITFNSYASIAMYPSFGLSLGDENRSFEISTRPIVMKKSDVHTSFSGISTLPFSIVLSSNLSGYDETYAKFFGMGDAFSGAYSVITEDCENAGYFYTGMIMSGDGGLVDIRALTGHYVQNFLLGSPISNFKYIKGYTGTPVGDINVERMYAKDESGKLVSYYYFNTKKHDGKMDIVHEQNNFAPIPNNWENSGFSRVYDNLAVENYVPRFSHGPFSIESKKFLYPNAQKALQSDGGKYKGFPTTVSFQLEIREEAVREIYAEFSIFPGTTDNISRDPTFIKVLRASKSYQAEDGIEEIGHPTIPTETTKMREIFVPDDPNLSYSYDFNNWIANNEASNGFNFSGGLFYRRSFITTGITYIDNNWAPLVSMGYYYSVASGKNYFLYDKTYFLNASNLSLPSNISRTYDDNIDDSFFIGGIRQKYYCDSEFWNFKTGVSGTAGYGLYKQFERKKPMNLPLYHFYSSKTGYVTLRYVPPVFDLGINSINITDDLMKSVSCITGTNINYGYGSPFYTFDRRSGEISQGMDPFFYEFMGGRRGGKLAEQEGGYNSKGIIGDRWIGTTDGYGVENIACVANTTILAKNPASDNRFLMFNSTPTGTDIFMNGMSFYPFNVDVKTKEFTTNKSFPAIDHTGGNISIPATIGDSGLLFFDIGTFFNLKLGTGWYSDSGITIGPFDRDVEIGITDLNSLTAWTDFYLNGKLLSSLNNPFLDFDDCYKEPDLFHKLYVDSTLGTSDGDIYQKQRNAQYSILDIIPSGKTANFNVHNVNRGNNGDRDLVGIQKYTYFIGSSPREMNVKLAVKAYIPIYDTAHRYSNPTKMGESRWINPHIYINNQKQNKVSIAHKSFKELEGTHNIFKYSTSGYLYPSIANNDSYYNSFGTFIDSTSGNSTYFTGWALSGNNAKFDDFGNLIYTNFDVESFWKTYATKTNKTVKYLGWREGSRLSLTIKRVVIKNDEIPYQTQKQISPSGTCTIQGSLSYKSQADSSIFTEGVYITNINPYPDLDKFYNPSFMSEVLTRLKGKQINPWPVGGMNAPILPAPSIMIQRRFVPSITTDQKYSGIFTAPPYNYNKLLWPAFSDLEILNPGETLEVLPPDDGSTFTSSSMIFSASQGQELPNGTSNPNIAKTYGSRYQFQTYDSMATDAFINSGKCITSRRGTENVLSRNNLKTTLTTMGTPISLINKGLL